MKPGRKLTSFTRQEVAQLFSRVQAKVRVPGLRILRAVASLDFGRILIVIPRKAGNAPERNLIRRRIKSIFREKKMYQEKYDFIVLIGREAISLSFLELQKLLMSAIKCS